MAMCNEEKQRRKAKSEKQKQTPGGEYKYNGIGSDEQGKGQ
jgi:hypothetical protein